MGAYEIITIIAILLGPVIGIQTQKWIERRNSKWDRKLNIFKILMATRAAILSPSHVDALNLIDIEFEKKRRKDKRVVDAWKTYLDHLANAPENEGLRQAWNEKSIDLLTRLLYEMGQCLGYDFDEVHIKRGGYLPVGFSRVDTEIHELRGELLQVLRGNKAIPMRVLEMPLFDEEFTRQQIKEVLEAVAGEKRELTSGVSSSTVDT
jgi:hypothetical protein